MRRLQQGKLPDGSDTEGRWSNYLSTHPDMEERLRGFEPRREGLPILPQGLADSYSDSPGSAPARSRPRTSWL